MDINKVTNLENLKIGGQMLRTLLAEGLLEEIARIRALAVGAHHGSDGMKREKRGSR